MGVEYPLLSDFPKNQVSRLYGVFNEQRGFANRTTFVIDKEGVIRRIDSGADAVEISGPKATCSLLD